MGSGQISRGRAGRDRPLAARHRDACYADMTRTYVVGEPAEDIVRYHTLCKEALDRSLAAIRAGRSGARGVRAGVRALPRGRPADAALEGRRARCSQDGFYHGLGHGVGLEVHEAPSLGRAPGSMVAGDVVTVEPGLYKHGTAACGSRISSSSPRTAPRTSRISVRPRRRELGPDDRDPARRGAAVSALARVRGTGERAAVDLRGAVRGAVGARGPRAGHVVRAVRSAVRVGAPVREVVPRREAERVLQLRRPARRGRARREGRVLLGGRAGRTTGGRSRTRICCAR